MPFVVKIVLVLTRVRHVFNCKNWNKHKVRDGPDNIAKLELGFWTKYPYSENPAFNVGGGRIEHSIFRDQANLIKTYSDVNYIKVDVNHIKSSMCEYS